MAVQSGMQRPAFEYDGGDGVASAVTASRAAWRRGDFELCISTINTVVAELSPRTAMGADAILLRARAKLRTNRAAEVVNDLRSIVSEFMGSDERFTARMLYASAFARVVDGLEGSALLDSVYRDAKRAHPSIRAEISYYQALALWTLRRYPEADERARETETARVDVLAVRATELRAYCAFAEARYPDALTLFRAAQTAYARCRERDVDLAAKIVYQVANLEQTLRSAKVDGTHRHPRSRIIPDDAFGSPNRSFARMRTRQNDGWLYALDGDARRAFTLMREAQELAPSAAWDIGALSNTALLAAYFGETLSAEQLLISAETKASQLDWSAVSGEERTALLDLVEALCVSGTSAPDRLLAVYDAEAPTADGLSATSVDTVLAAWIEYVRGLVLRVEGNAGAARAALERAYRQFRANGCMWRAALALIELDATPAPTTARGDFHLETAALLVREHFPHSFLADRLGRWGNAYRDPIARKLTPAQREVLRYALDGHGAVEIARLCGRAEKTVRKHLTALHEAFGVDTTLRLVAICHARGLGSPAWRSPVAGAHAETG
jgi:DNA-binding CsgD family transcriptional regulator